MTAPLLKSTATRLTSVRAISAPEQQVRLLPALVRTASLDRASLGSSAFGSTPASVAVAKDLRVVFQAQLQGQREESTAAFTHDELEQLGLGALEAWERAKGDVLDAVGRNGRGRFRIRDCSALIGKSLTGVQWDCLRFPATTWLCHPGLFRLIDRHFQSLLHTDHPVYFAPTSKILLVFPHRPKELEVAAQRIQLKFENSPELLDCRAYLCEKGFPALLSEVGV